MGSGKEQFYHRVGHISIMGEDGSMHSYGGNDGLDFKFRIKKPIGAVRMQADISILGLSIETVKFLTCWQPWNVSAAKKRKIEVYAGYESSGEQLVFEGYIISAMPTNPPEMWLNIKADNLAFADDEIRKLERMDKPTVKDIFNKVAKMIGLVPSWKSKRPEKRIKEFSFTGETQELLQRLESLDEIYVYEDSGELIAVDRTPKSVEKSRTRELSTETGLLAIGNINFTGVEVSARFDTRFNRNDWLKLKSNLIEGATGLYWIYQVQYEGHFRGDPWYVKVLARSQRNV